MKNTKTTIEQQIENKMAVLDVLKDVLGDIEYRESGLLREFKYTGRDEQRTDRDGNLLYIDDEGNKTTEVTDKPYMKEIWDNFERPVEDLEGRDLAKYNALQEIKANLLKMM